MKLLSILIALGLMVSNVPGLRSATKPAKPEHAFDYRFSNDLKQSADSEARLEKWYKDAKFGAFIHFGVYSMLEGQYEDGRGKEHHYSEWIQIAARIPQAEYHELASQFNPQGFDAEEWAQVFKDAGMKYVIITSKHHDGFALFDSDVSDYNIVDATPFKRDIIRELLDACHRKGLKFGVYYSQAQDWDEPDAPYLNKKFKLRDLHPGLPRDFQPDMERYLMSKSLPQVEELVRSYELDTIWFDTPVGMTFESARRFRDIVRKYRPDCIINSRIIYGGKDQIEQQSLELFDYVSIGDKEVPPVNLPVYFESPDSVSSSYAYKKHGDVTYHSEKEMIERLIHTVCSNGNYLLNNGPMGTGRLDPKAVRIYQTLGKWMRVNGEAIYNTRANPLATRPDWGNISTSKDGKILYLHVLEWPEDGSLELSGLESQVRKASLIRNGKRLRVKSKHDQLSIAVPEKALDPFASVIKLELK